MKPMAGHRTIGERIKEVFQAKPKTFTIDDFARKLHCDRRNVFRIFRRTNIDIMLLARISDALDHNFFADLAADQALQSAVSNPVTDGD